MTSQGARRTSGRASSRGTVTPTHPAKPARQTRSQSRRSSASADRSQVSMTDCNHPASHTVQCTLKQVIKPVLFCSSRPLLGQHDRLQSLSSLGKTCKLDRFRLQGSAKCIQILTKRRRGITAGMVRVQVEDTAATGRRGRKAVMTPIAEDQEEGAQFKAKCSPYADSSCSYLTASVWLFHVVCNLQCWPCLQEATHMTNPAVTQTLKSPLACFV